jgi:hypothetical protein
MNKLSRQCGILNILRGQLYFFFFPLRYVHCAEAEVTLRLTASKSRCRAHSGACDQILLSVRRLLSEICGLFSIGRPL